MERRLAAILAADVVGYTRLMGADEAGTLKRLTELRVNVIAPLIAEHHGHVVKLLGDGLLVTFASVVDAVGCAVAWQVAVTQHEGERDASGRFAFRIGINVGDVIFEDGDIHGDGVNIAARLEGLADPGGIFLSGDAYRQVRGKIVAAFHDLGERTVKNVAEPLRVYRVAHEEADGAATWQAGDSAVPPDKATIAVLPFTNMSGDPGQEYLADGITEDIITALTHWRSFPVIARNSSFAYRNKRADIKQVSRELGARYLLEGSVRTGGGRVRVTAQLVDGLTGHDIWAERYDRELADVFALQDEIVQRITAIVAPELVKAEAKRSTAKRPNSLDAWDYCLRGMALLHERAPEANARARALFNEAIALQPDYSDAYAGIANSLSSDILLQSAEDRMETAERAMEAARMALKYDSASSWAHHELATAYQWLNRHDDALAEVKIAVSLNPNEAVGLHALGNKSDLAGDPDGIQYMEKAQTLNPEDAQLHTHLTFLARAYFNTDNFEEAIDRARQAIRRQPDYAPAHYMLALALGQIGRTDEARRALVKVEVLHPGLVEARKSWQPYVDPVSNQKLREALRQLES